MSLFDLYPDQDANIADQMARAPTQEPASVATWGAVGKAIPLGLANAATSVYQLGSDLGAHAIATGENQANDMAMATSLVDQPNPFAASAQLDRVNHTPDEWEQQQQQASKKLVDSTMPDPRTSGWLSNTLFGLASVIPRAAVPLVGPMLAASTEGYNTKKTLTSQGVDDATATNVGMLSGVTTLAGVGTPMAFGETLLKKVATGAVLNPLLGIADRGSTGAILDQAGYHDMAQQYHMLDAQALLTDTVFGAAFGGLAHLHALGDGAEKMSLADRMAKPAPSTVDAALASNDQLHVERAGVGIPTDPVSRDNNTYNFGEGLNALLNNEQPMNLRDVSTTPDTTRDAAQNEAVNSLAAVVREAQPETEPAVFTNERRQTVRDSNRLDELSNKMDSGGNLNAAEMSELIKLQRDQLYQARVEGGTPIRGVLSREGAARQLAKQEFSHVTMMDANDFKSVNDQFGHPVGDQVIQHIGETLAKHAPEGTLLEHRGGDEFLLHHNGEDVGAKVVADANADLAKTKIHALDDAGNIVKTREGVSLAHGTGENEKGKPINEKSADERLHENKDALKRDGKRIGDRDAQPVAGEPAQDRGAAGGGEAGRDDGGTAPVLDPETHEALAAAQQALAEHPDLHIESDEEGGLGGKARDLLNSALQDIREAPLEGELHKVAAACFGRV